MTTGWEICGASVLGLTGTDAFFGGTATPETYPELWKKLIEEFTPDREEKGLYPEIDPSNAFIGLYVRLEALSQYGAYDVLMSNIEGFFAPMAKTTGTLWEDKYGAASCNHGFASHVLVWMDKAMKE
jgi:alpha-L-rhamnosidase